MKLLFLSPVGSLGWKSLIPVLAAKGLRMFSYVSCEVLSWMAENHTVDLMIGRWYKTIQCMVHSMGWDVKIYIHTKINLNPLWSMWIFVIGISVLNTKNFGATMSIHDPCRLIFYMMFLSSILLSQDQLLYLTNWDFYMLKSTYHNYLHLM